MVADAVTDAYEELFLQVRSGGEVSLGHVMFVDLVPYDLSFRVDTEGEDGGIERVWVMVPYQRLVRQYVPLWLLLAKSLLSPHAASLFKSIGFM